MLKFFFMAFVEAAYSAFMLAVVSVGLNLWVKIPVMPIPAALIFGCVITTYNMGCRLQAAMRDQQPPKNPPNDKNKMTSALK